MTRRLDMLAQIATALQSSRNTLLEDATGASALVVMLIVALHLPGII